MGDAVLRADGQTVDDGIRGNLPGHQRRTADGGAQVGGPDHVVTIRRASIETDRVPVVTGFRAHVQDAVAASVHRAARKARIGGHVVAVVTFFDTGVDEAVPAKRRDTTGHAVVGIVRIPVVALLGEGVSESVATDVLRAVVQAGIVLGRVAVVTVLDASVEKPIPAAGDLAPLHAIVGIVRIPVVALLVHWIEHAVAAHVPGAVVPATVLLDGVAVVAFLPCVGHAVTAARQGAIGPAGVGLYVRQIGTGIARLPSGHVHVPVAADRQNALPVETDAAALIGEGSGILGREGIGRVDHPLPFLAIVHGAGIAVVDLEGRGRHAAAAEAGPIPLAGGSPRAGCPLLVAPLTGYAAEAHVAVGFLLLSSGGIEEGGALRVIRDDLAGIPRLVALDGHAREGRWGTGILSLLTDAVDAAFGAVAERAVVTFDVQIAGAPEDRLCRTSS